eukprot:13059587-Alexandrium_andersonii.AAC.1
MCIRDSRELVDASSDAGLCGPKGQQAGLAGAQDVGQLQLAQEAEEFFFTYLFGYRSIVEARLVIWIAP